VVFGDYFEQWKVDTCISISITIIEKLFKFITFVKDKYNKAFHTLMCPREICINKAYDKIEE
jgi:hypothetical protein